MCFRGLAGCVALAFVPACDSPRWVFSSFNLILFVFSEPLCETLRLSFDWSHFVVRASLYLFILSSFPSFFFNLLCDSEEGRKGKDKTNERLAISFLPFYRFSPTTHPLLERSELKKPKVDGEVVGENPKGKKEIQESREMS